MRRAVKAVLTAVMIGAGAVLVAAATNASAASAATAPPGYQRVIGAPIPIPPGLFDSGGQVACPAGTVPWGGGAGYTITSATGTDTGGPVTDLAGAQCPAGTSILGGGIHVTSPRPAVTLGFSDDDSGPQWLSEVLNDAPQPATATTYAICAA